ncbi:MAG: DNA glycosylase [Methanolinea sp.]|jgi:N-glycosylase/DNA lyase|nr:DNA glycosylase [Methanolinea sp.]
MPSVILAKDQPFDLDLSLSCGQVFGWERKETAWRGIVGQKVIRIVQKGDRLSFSGADAGFIRHYFALDVDLPEILSSIDRDPVIHYAVSSCSGLRIIRQPPWECLASFICATYSNIPGIRKRVHLLCQNLGASLSPEYPGLFSFPSPTAIAGAETCMLSGCSLGYRAEYLRETARVLAADTGWEERIDALPFPKARANLLRLKGVGKKVADCVLLFAFGKWESFPVDVWIERIMTRCYPECRDLRTYDKISDFGRAYFGKYAGYAQEYLYCCRTVLTGRVDAGKGKGGGSNLYVPDSQPER